MADHEFLAPQPGSVVGRNRSTSEANNSLQTEESGQSGQQTKGTLGNNNMQSVNGGAIPKINITFKAPLPNTTTNPHQSPSATNFNNAQNQPSASLQSGASLQVSQSPGNPFGGHSSLMMRPVQHQMQRQAISASRSSIPSNMQAMNRPIAPMRPPYNPQQQLAIQNDIVRNLMIKKQNGTASNQELESLHRYMQYAQRQQQQQQQQMQMQQQHLLPHTPTNIHHQAQVLQQQQMSSVQQKMAMAQAQARQGQGRLGPSRPMPNPQNQMNNQQRPPPNMRPSLLPAQNTYGPRIQKGGTSMILNVAAPEPAQRTRRGRFVEDSQSEEEETSDSEVTDSEDEDQLARRQAKKELRLSKQKIPEITHVAPFKPRKKTRHILATRHEYDKMHIYQVDQIAGAREVLVPISVEVDIDLTYKFQDSFSWNLNEPAMTPEKFAEYICLDLNLNMHPHQGAISRSIRAQLDEYRKYFLYSDAPIPQDTRTVIKLDITAGKVQLRDRFEWDMASGLSPEDFALILVADLHLGGEFVSLVAHSIREQLYKVKSSGEFDPSFPIEKPFRSEEEAKSWAPYVDCGEVEGDEGLSIEEDRKQRLLRRQLRVNSTLRGRGYQRGYLIHDENSSSMPPIVGASHPTQAALSAEEKAVWRCSHCSCSFSQTPSIFSGPKGENTLCRSCGLYYEEEQTLPDHRLGMFK